MDELNIHLIPDLANIIKEYLMIPCIGCEESLFNPLLKCKECKNIYCKSCVLNRNIYINIRNKCMPCIRKEMEKMRELYKGRLSRIGMGIRMKGVRKKPKPKRGIKRGVQHPNLLTSFFNELKKYRIGI